MIVRPVHFRALPILFAVLACLYPVTLRLLRGRRRVEVFVLPDGQSAGMLEDLCLRSVQADPGIACVAEYFECIRRDTQRQPIAMSKARVHAWLASQARPDLRLGEAAAQGYWPWENPAFDLIKGFLLRL